MNDSMIEQGPQSVETSLFPNSVSAAADITVSDRSKDLSQGKKGVVRTFAAKATLTLSALSLLISSGCGNIAGEKVNQLVEKPSISASHIEDSFRFFGGIEVVLDKEEARPTPSGYILPNGEMVKLDKEKVRELRNKAISSGEPQLITVFPAEDVNENNQDKFVQRYFEKSARISLTERGYKPSQEHPRTLELPPDVVPKEELEERGITIIQPPGNSGNLYIRESAFAKDGPLGDFNNSNTERKLTIVLIDGPFLSEKFAQDKRYNSVRKYFHRFDFIESYLEEDKQNLLKDLDAQNEEIKKLSTLSIEEQEEGFGIYYAQAQQIMLEIKIKLAIYDSYKKGRLTGGQFLKMLDPFPKTAPLAQGTFIPSEEGDIILLSVFNDAPIKHVMYFDKEGQFIAESSPSPWRSDRLEAEETHPNPAELGLETNPSTPDKPLHIYFGGGPYAFLGQKPHGFKLRHEVEHGSQEEKRRGTGIKDLDIGTEYGADMKAMEEIQKAWNRWQGSGFTDNSGYHFVFSLSPEQGGGYILTRHKKQKTPLVSA